jgi:hypothetical protein
MRLSALPTSSTEMAHGDQGEFKNRRKRRSRRGNEAEVFFAPKSASLRRRLPLTLEHTPHGDAAKIS